MQQFQLLMALYQGAMVLWVVAIGACVGSLINVLVYRLPEGKSVVRPASRCPKCDTKLTWKDNIPVFGWIFLGGKCRYCKNPISIEYPLVELFCGLLFGLVFLLWYVVPDGAVLAGIPWGEVRPEWAKNDQGAIWPKSTWPEFLVLLTLLGCLVAMTIIDARTYTIQLELAWIPAALALVLYTGHAAYIEFFGAGELRWRAIFQDWAIATPWTDASRGGPDAQVGWWWIGASLGGVLGVGATWLLLKFSVFKQSFADYDEWEEKKLAELRAEAEAAGEEPPESPEAVQLWTLYPHARREMFRELMHALPIVALAAVGGWLSLRLAGPWVYSDELLTVVPDAGRAPLWLTVLAGVCMGYLVGGGVIWGVRIFGSIAFGKEAMGFGDVHLLAAIGACLGWIDAVLAFFLACVVGSVWGIAGAMMKGKLARALPFGPYLAVGALLVVLLKPILEMGLTALFRSPFPIDLP